MMNENEMLYCLIAFILGYLISRHMGDGFNVGIAEICPTIKPGGTQVACCNPNEKDSLCPKYFRVDKKPSQKCQKCGEGKDSCLCPKTCIQDGKRCTLKDGETSCCSNNCADERGGSICRPAPLI